MKVLLSLSGWLAVLALVGALGSGVLLGWTYVPSTEAAYGSTLACGPWTRALHHHASHATLALALLHALLLLLPRRRAAPDAVTEAPHAAPVEGVSVAEAASTAVASAQDDAPGVPWLSGAAALACAVLAAYSGRVLPWDAHGAVSLRVAEGFFGVRFAGLSAVLWLHLAATAAIVVALSAHVSWRAARDLSQRQQLVLVLAALLLCAAALVVAAPLGARYLPAALEPRLVGAEWYLRWLEWLGLVAGVRLAQFVALALLLLAVATPALARRLGDERVRWLWLLLFAVLTLSSLLPAGRAA